MGEARETEVSGMTMDTSLENRLGLARDVALAAGELVRRRFQSRDAGAFTMKGHQDYLTEADAEVEAFVTERIQAAFPGDCIFGEEGGGEIGVHTWVVDPIDGTANFARGIPHFCVSIAYVRDGAPQIGAIANPVAGELFMAARGGGAFCNDRVMQVSAINDMRQATIELGWSTRLPISSYVTMVDRVMASGAGMRRAGSGALGLTDVAAGRIDGYAELHMNSWDALAGLLLVQEAGGWTNDFLAGDVLRSGNPILACTPGLAPALRAATGIRQ
jgi:myo-inositol-1(or 4)-monophosphatase